jgi:predicted transcriptional regulator
MQIDLPDAVIEQARRLAGANEDAADVIARALESWEWEGGEVAAVQQGIADYEAGDHEPWEDFSGRLMAERRITPEQ